MSRIAKNSIKLPQDTTCSFDNNILLVQGKLGKATLPISELFTIKQKIMKFLFYQKMKKIKLNPLWGTTSAHVKNTLSGVCNGFSKHLCLMEQDIELQSVDSKLKLQLGFSHDIDYEIPKEVKIECPKQNIIKITSIHKEILGAVAAKIRSYRKPEPFKGKGIKYENEFIFRKEGKKK